MSEALPTTGRAFLLKNNINMTLLEQIQNWLLSEDRDFQTGLQMYINASHNRSVMLYLQRKTDQRKLEYELQKMVKLLPERLSKIPAYEIGVVASAKPLAKKKIATTTEDKHKILEPRRINPEGLPDDLKKVYDEIATAYKEQRVYHEKMKLATTDEERKKHRAKVLELDAIISNGWNILDEWQLIKNQGGVYKPKSEKKEENVVDKAKAINACRSYISKGVTALPQLKPEKAEARKIEIRKRVDILIQLGVTVKKETRDQLITLNVIDDNSPLQIETDVK